MNRESLKKLVVPCGALILGWAFGTLNAPTPPHAPATAGTVLPAAKAPGDAVGLDAGLNLSERGEGDQAATEKLNESTLASALRERNRSRRAHDLFAIVT